MSTVIPILVFVITLALVITRPKYMGIGVSACLGAFVVYLLGYVTNADVMQVVQLTWNATLAFVALIVICYVLDEIGIFDWAAITIMRLSKNSYKRLFVHLVILGALVSVFFANDGAALILTPIIIAKMRLLDIPSKKILPFIMAGGFIADSASLPLITSNLVNIIAADYFQITYEKYALYMIVPFIVAVIVSLLVLYGFYRKNLNDSTSSTWKIPEKNPIKSRALSITLLILITLMFAGCFVGGYFYVPVSIILMPTAIILTVIAILNRVTTFKKIYYATPFSIIFFALGMFLVIFSLKDAGLIKLLSSLIEGFATLGNFVATLLTGLLAAILSCFANNLPAVMVNSLAISNVEWSLLQERLFSLANVIGCDIGPKMFPMGSLATLLWLHLLEKRNLKIGYGYYIKVGIILTVPTLLATLASLYLWVKIIH